MTTLALALTLLAHPTPACETYTPRLDGTVVTVCGGRVTRVRMATPAELTAQRAATRLTQWDEGGPLVL